MTALSRSIRLPRSLVLIAACELGRAAAQDLSDISILSDVVNITDPPAALGKLRYNESLS